MEIRESNALIQSYTDYAIKEAVRHFLKTTGKKDTINEPRYLYTEAQRKVFLDMYAKKGGNLDNIEIIKINDDFNEFLCYAVLRAVAIV